MKKRKAKRPPIKIVVAFGPVTVEKFEAMPERVKDDLGRLIYGFFMRLAEEKANAQGAARLAA